MTKNPNQDLDRDLVPNLENQDHLRNPDPCRVQEKVRVQDRDRDRDRTSLDREANQDPSRDRVKVPHLRHAREKIRGQGLDPARVPINLNRGLPLDREPHVRDHVQSPENLYQDRDLGRDQNQVRDHIQERVRGHARARGQDHVLDHVRDQDPGQQLDPDTPLVLNLGLDRDLDQPLDLESLEVLAEIRME